MDVGYVRNDKWVKNLLDRMVIRVIPQLNTANDIYRPGNCASSTVEKKDMFGALDDVIVDNLPHVVLSLEAGGVGTSFTDKYGKEKDIFQNFASEIANTRSSKEPSCAIADDSNNNHLLEKWGVYLIRNHVTCCSAPSEKDLPVLWMKNLQPIRKFISSCLIGVSGHVTSASGDPLPHASVHALGRAMTLSPTGFFHRVFAPGRHLLRADAPGYLSLTQEVTLRNDTVAMEFKLQPEVKLSRYRNASTIISTLEQLHFSHPNLSRLQR